MWMLKEKRKKSWTSLGKIPTHPPLHCNEEESKKFGLLKRGNSSFEKSFEKKSVLSFSLGRSHCCLVFVLKYLWTSKLHSIIQIHNISHSDWLWGIFYRILSVPHNNVMDLDNVMCICQHILVCLFAPERQLAVGEGDFCCAKAFVPRLNDSGASRSKMDALLIWNHLEWIWSSTLFMFLLAFIQAREEQSRGSMSSCLSQNENFIISFLWSGRSLLSNHTCLTTKRSYLSFMYLC